MHDRVRNERAGRGFYLNFLVRIFSCPLALGRQRPSREAKSASTSAVVCACLCFVSCAVKCEQCVIVINQKTSAPHSEACEAYRETAPPVTAKISFFVIFPNLRPKPPPRPANRCARRPKSSEIDASTDRRSLSRRPLCCSHRLQLITLTITSSFFAKLILYPVQQRYPALRRQDDEPLCTLPFSDAGSHRHTKFASPVIAHVQETCFLRNLLCRLQG